LLINTIKLVGAIALVIYVIVTTASEWLHGLEKYPTIKKFVEAKALRATLLIVAIILLFGVFQDIIAVREALNVPPPVPKAPPAPIIQKQEPTPNFVRSVAPKPDTKPPVQINSAPNGIAIGGGTVTNPTVNNNNFAPPQRALSEDQKTSLIACLKTNPGKYTIGALSGIREAYTYAQDWYNVFNGAGWKNEQSIPIVTMMIGSGIFPPITIGFHGSYDNTSKTFVLAEGSPERTAVQCLDKASISGGETGMASQDNPTGTIRITISDR
jgi:hypothetical protein